MEPEPTPYQPCTGENTDEPAPRAWRGIYYYAAAALLILLLAASLVQVDIVVAGTGRIVSGAPPVTLHAEERAIVRAINVKTGDTVKKGQVLATLAPLAAGDGPSLPRPGLETLVLRKKSLEAELRRIEAEVLGTPFSAADETDPADILQLALYGRRELEYSARLRSFDEEIGRLETMIAAMQDDRRFLARQLSLAAEVEAMHADLQQPNPASKLQALESRSSRLRYERDHQSLVDKLAEARHGVMVARAERQAFIDQWRKQLLEDLVIKRRELDQVNGSLAQAARQYAPVPLKAPEDGVVLGVAPRPAGAVVREAEPLVTLAPGNAPLIAEVTVTSPDIGYASPGDRVTVTMDAFSHQRHGPMEGRLLSVSQAPFTSWQRAPGPSGEAGAPPRPRQGAVHRARIALTGIGAGALPDGARLAPGMTLSAEIKAGRRSVLSYFLSPIARGFGGRRHDL